MNEKLRTLAKGTRGKLLIEALEEVQRKVADIRNELNVKPEIQNEVRLGIIEALDSFLIEPLKVSANEYTPTEETFT